VKDNKPLIGITMGDPTGIGPEVAVKALNLKEIYSICKPVIIGDAGRVSIRNFGCIGYEQRRCRQVGLQKSQQDGG